MAVRKVPTRRQLLWLAWLSPLTMVVAAGSWTLGTQSGLIWVSSTLQRYSGDTLRMEGEHGSLLGGFGMQHVQLRGDGWRVSLEGLDLDWDPAALWCGEWHVLKLRLHAVEVATSASDTEMQLPKDLLLPLDITLEQLEIGSIRIAGSEEAGAGLQAEALRARLTSDQTAHHLQVASAKLPYGELVGTFDIATRSPYAVQTTAMLEIREPMRASYRLQLTGDLQHLDAVLDGKGDGMQLQGTAQLQPLASMPLAQARLSFSGIATQWLDAAAPPARLDGGIELHAAAQDRLEGKLAIENLHAVPLDKAGLPLRRLQAGVRWSERYWQLFALDARIGAAGQVIGEMDWRPLSDQGAMRLHVSGLDPQAIDTRAPHMRLAGDIALGSTGNEQQMRLALADGDFVIDGGLHRHGDSVTLHELRFARGGTELVNEGELKLDSARSFHLDSHLRRLDLHDLLGRAQTDLNAVLSATGRLQPEPEVALDFKLERSRFSRYAIDGGGRFHFGDGKQAEGDFQLRIGDNTLDAELRYGTAADYFRVRLEAPDLQQLGDGIQGKLSGQAELRGDPAEPVVDFALAGRTLVFPDSGSIDQLDAGGRYDAKQLALQLAASGVHLNDGLAIPVLRLEAAGDRDRHTLQGTADLVQDGQALGRWHVESHGGFGDADPAWQWLGMVDVLEADGVLPLRLQAPAKLSFAPGKAELGPANLALGDGEVTLQTTRWAVDGWHSVGRFTGLGAVNLPQTLKVASAFDTLRFGGDWDVALDSHWHGHADIRRESGDWMIDTQSGQQLGLTGLGMSVGVVQDMLSVQLDAVGARLGTVAAQVRLPLSQQADGWTIAGDAPLAGHVSLHADDLTWLGPVLHDNLQSAGSLVLDADLRGTFAVPRLRGAVHGDGLRVALLDQGVNLEQGSLRARFETDDVLVEQIEFSAPYLFKPDDKLLDDYRLPAGVGHLSASGRIDLEGPDSDLKVQATALPLLQRADRWLIVSGTGHVGYASRALSLHGDVRADAGLLAQIETGKPQWADDVKIVGQGAQEGKRLAYDIDAGFDLGDHFYLRAAGLESRLTGQLHLQGEAGASLQATGIIATQDGLFNAYGQQLTVDRGMVNFQGPPEDPGLNILALRKGLSVEAGVEVTGTARHPVIHLVSTPTVPDAEKLSWIVLGRVPESGSIDSSLLLAAAGSLLGGQSVGHLGRSIGVDELSLRQRETGDALQNQVVTVGKRLSSRAYLSYEQGLSDVGGLTKFTYTLTPRVTIVTRTGTEDALDLFYSFRFY